MESGMIPAELPQCLLLDLVLNATAAQSPDLTSGRIDDHHGSRLLGRRASGFDDLAQDQFSIHFQGPNDLLYDVTHTLRSRSQCQEVERPDHARSVSS